MNKLQSTKFVRQAFTLCMCYSLFSKSCYTMASQMFHCDFEVYGIVQGVFFRKYTQEQASKLGLKGWCMNTTEGTVKGQIEGNEKSIKEMQNWLKTTGSPKSKIDKAVFGQMEPITAYRFNDFQIKR